MAAVRMAEASVVAMEVAPVAAAMVAAEVATAEQARVCHRGLLSSSMKKVTPLQLGSRMTRLDAREMPRSRQLSTSSSGCSADFVPATFTLHTLVQGSPPLPSCQHSPRTNRLTAAVDLLLHHGGGGKHAMLAAAAAKKEKSMA
eukprot:5566855-Prymnesium_polylepis.1